MDLIELSKADDLIIKKSRLYKWSASGKYKEIFIKVEGTIFVDKDALWALLEKMRTSHEVLEDGID